MKDPNKQAVIILDIVLIMMTVVWILRGVFVGLGVIEIIYNYIYVFTNILTLILNLRILYNS